eukprot:GGOE01016546.1.p2 GENE.GGOE01016546.1~~GGOE01016546.1.p2  ORF type:complete len:121 (-),score=6.50 GGOE01016546.1:177-539(-)
MQQGWKRGHRHTNALYSALWCTTKSGFHNGAMVARREDDLLAVQWTKEGGGGGAGVKDVSALGLGQFEPIWGGERSHYIRKMIFVRGRKRTALSWSTVVAHIYAEYVAGRIFSRDGRGAG